MSSPIKGSDFDNQHLSDSLCSSFQEKLLNNAKLKLLLDYLFQDDGTIDSPFATDLVELLSPIGEVLWFPVDPIDMDSDVYVKAEGQQVLKATYARLFARYGTAFDKVGDTNTATYFRVPDLRSRFVAGAGSGTDAEANIGASVGDTGGAKSEDVVLTAANVAPHKHDIGVEGDGDASTTQSGRLRVGSGTEVDWQDVDTAKVGHTRMSVPTNDLDVPVTPITVPTIPPVIYGVYLIRANWKVAGNIL